VVATPIGHSIRRAPESSGKFECSFQENIFGLMRGSRRPKASDGLVQKTLCITWNGDQEGKEKR
jgi:hypothetical protein